MLTCTNVDQYLKRVVSILTYFDPLHTTRVGYLTNSEMGLSDGMHHTHNEIYDWSPLYLNLV